MSTSEQPNEGVEVPYPDGVPFVKWTGDMDAMPPPPWVARNEQGRLVYVPLFGMTTYVQPPAASGPKEGTDGR